VIDIPDLEQHMDVSVAQLCKLKDTTIADPNNPNEKAAPAPPGDSDDEDES